MEQTHSSHFCLSGLFTVSNTERLRENNGTEVVEIILLGGKPTKELISKHFESTANLKVFELSDRQSKMALLRQLKLDSLTSDDLHGHENSLTNNTSDNTRGVKKNIGTYALPLGTVLRRQSNKGNKTKFQYEIENQREPLEPTKETKEMSETTTTSDVNSTTSWSPMENSKRIQRLIRNKKTVEVRRNPTRVSKKNMNENVVNPRQRLLSAKRKENIPNAESTKQVKFSTTPYMSTRSVTRKLYTEGATYNPPTIQDSVEWKEWPDHGMHERPYFHPRFGLGIECIGRFFKTLGCRSFPEIREEPEVEVIFIDSCDETENPLDFNKIKRRKIKKLNVKRNESISGKENKSFKTCMHTSLHSVLAYCAQISDPKCHTSSQNKTENLKITSCEKESNQELQEDSNLENEIEAGSRVDKKTPIEIDSLESGEIEVLSFNGNHSKVSNQISRLEAKKCLITSRNSENLTTDLQADHSKLQEPKRKNSIAQVECQKPSILTNNQLLKPTRRELNFEPEKLNDPTINDETSMEMSSNCKKLDSIVKKDDSEMENCVTRNEVEDSNKNKNQTSEIAKILSEYIESINKVPEIENCVLRSGLKINKSAACYNNQKKRGKKPKKSESKALPKSRVSPANKKDIAETKDIERNKIEVTKKLDLSIPKSKEEKRNKENEKSIGVKPLQNLLENTAILYCAATGVHQESLANYIDNLDAEQSVGWLIDNDW